MAGISPIDIATHGMLSDPLGMISLGFLVGYTSDESVSPDQRIRRGWKSGGSSSNKLKHHTQTLEASVVFDYHVYATSPFINVVNEFSGLKSFVVSTQQQQILMSAVIEEVKSGLLNDDEILIEADVIHDE